MTTLRESLIEFLKSIGRWILDWIRTNGSVLLRGYVCGKIDDFERRLEALREKPRGWTKSRHQRVRRRLRLRIRRWKAFSEFLSVTQRGSIENEALRCAEDPKIAKLPMIAKGEIVDDYPNAGRRAA